jgi:Putative sensor
MTHVDLTTVTEGPSPSLVGRTHPRRAGATPRPGRVRAWTRSSLRDLVYAGAVGVWSVVGFTVLVTGVSVTSSLLVLVVGVFVWIGFAHVLRWMTLVDRALAGWRRQERVPAVYRRPGARGLTPYLKTLSSDPQTWRDLAWLGVTSIVGFASGLVVITAAGLAVTYVSMPLWYWAISDPRTEYGVTNLGLFTVDTLREAGFATAIGLAIIPLVLLLARWCAATHAGLAVRLLGPSTDQAPTDDARAGLAG